MDDRGGGGGPGKSLHMKALPAILVPPQMPMGKGGWCGHDSWKVLQIYSTELDNTVISTRNFSEPV